MRERRFLSFSLQENITQRARGVGVVSYWRRCYVITSHRHRYDVSLALNARWQHFATFCVYLNISKK